MAVVDVVGTEVKRAKGCLAGTIRAQDSLFPDSSADKL